LTSEKFSASIAQALGLLNHAEMHMKRKLTAAQKRARRERKKNFMKIFINGREKWVRRPPTIDGLPVDEFIARNADPIWLHQNELWELMPPGGEG
jgi:enoyl-CoA hydratase/carnithine racemase